MTTGCSSILLHCLVQILPYSAQTATELVRDTRKCGRTTRPAILPMHIIAHAALTPSQLLLRLIRQSQAIKTLASSRLTLTFRKVFTLSLHPCDHPNLSFAMSSVISHAQGMYTVARLIHQCSSSNCWIARIANDSMDTNGSL